MARGRDISVIIASYNIEGYILRAIDSALAQEGVSLEVIVVDDCSSDGTWQAITSINNPRVTTYRMAHNSGPSAARNQATALAQGRWIAILDGDDVFYPGRLARMLALGESVQADIVVDNLQVHREIDGSNSLMFTAECMETMKTLSVAQFITGNSNFIDGGFGLGYVKPLIRRAFLEQHKLRYRESTRIGEDYMLMLELLVSGAVCVVDVQAGYGYTQRAGSISHRLTPADVARIQAEDADFLARYKLDDAAHVAQNIRSRRLDTALVYNQLVVAIKARNVVEGLRLAAAHPLVLYYLRLPLLAWLRAWR